jgi:hypothetical protein
MLGIGLMIGRKKIGEADSITVLYRRAISFLAARHIQQGLA